MNIGRGNIGDSAVIEENSQRRREQNSGYVVVNEKEGVRGLSIADGYFIIGVNISNGLGATFRHMNALIVLSVVIRYSCGVFIGDTRN